MTALVNAASLARETPAVYVIEDAHWIDEVSESMLADFLTVIPQTPSLVLVTYRPEYEGALTRVHGAQTIALAPLSDSETAALVVELLGPDPSVGRLGRTIAERAAGNPFFAEEIVRELAERGVLQGKPRRIHVDGRGRRGERACHLAGDHRRAHRPARPESQTHAERGGGDRLAVQLRPADCAWASNRSSTILVAAELIDQVRFTRQPEYVFHHPLIRAVAYESQLKSDRAELHRRRGRRDRST